MDVLVIGGVFREVLDADTAPRPRYGGSGLTASVAAARFGARVALASYVGSEDEAAVRTELAVADVDDHAVVTLGGACGTFLFPTKDHERPWPMYRPAEQVPSHVPELPQAGIVVVFGIPDCDLVEMGWLGSGNGDATIVWDRQGWLSRARDSKAVVGLRARTRVYLANESEAIEDAGVGSFAEALGGQPPRGFDTAFLKRGDAGVVVVERAGEDTTRTHVPSFPIRATSTVGSGDIFAGVLAAQLSRGEPPASAARWACAAAAVALRGEQNLLSSDAYSQAQDLISG